MDAPQIAESWMVGHFCHACDDEIEQGDFVIVLDIDYSDQAGRPVAKIAHEDCAAGA
jgi:hypothetical protein